MQSIEECRALIDRDEKYTDEEIAKIRDSLDQLASIFVDQYFAEKTKARLQNKASES